MSVNPLKHWEALVASRRRIEAALRSRLIAHRKAGEAAPRLERAYRRWKALVAQAERGLAKARKARHKLVMFDDVNVGLLPAGGDIYGVYVDGHFANHTAVAAKFPSARLLTITVIGSKAEAGDIETGDMTPASGARWARRMLAAGVHRPVCYANRSTMPAVIAELRAAGIRRSQVRLWVADYTFHPHLPVLRWGSRLTTADACQWTDKSHGRSLDESICVPSFLD